VIPEFVSRVGKILNVFWLPRPTVFREFSLLIKTPNKGDALHLPVIQGNKALRVV